MIEKAVEKTLSEKVWKVEVVYRAVRVTLQNGVKLQMVQGGFLVVAARYGEYDEEESRIAALINKLDDEVLKLENFLEKVITMNQAYLGLVESED